MAFTLYLYQRDIEGVEQELRESMGMVACEPVAEKRPEIIFERRIRGTVFNANSGGSAGAMCRADAQCYQLEGEFIVGGEDGPGFPPDTRTGFVITYTISGDRVRGV